MGPAPAQNGKRKAETRASPLQKETLGVHHLIIEFNVLLEEYHSDLQMQAANSYRTSK